MLGFNFLFMMDGVKKQTKQKTVKNNNYYTVLWTLVRKLASWERKRALLR